MAIEFAPIVAKVLISTAVGRLVGAQVDNREAAAKTPGDCLEALPVFATEERRIDDNAMPRDQQRFREFAQRSVDVAPVAGGVDAGTDRGIASLPFVETECAFALDIGTDADRRQP